MIGAGGERRITMSTVEASRLSRLHDLRLTSPTISSCRIASWSEKNLAKACREKKAPSVYSSNGSHRGCRVMQVSVKEAQQEQLIALQTAELVRLRVPTSRKSEPNPQATWTKMMTDIKETGTPVPVLKVYNKAGKLSKETVVGTLMRFKKLKEWKFITKIVRWLKKQNWWTFSELDYNLLIAAYGKMGEPEKVKKTISRMKKSGYQPNVASYTSLIEAYGKKGLLYEAEGILNEMREEGPTPTALTYQTMIGAFVKGGKHEDAERIFQNLEADDIVKPDQKLFNLMIHSYGKCGKIEEAIRLSRKMKALGIPLSVVTFNSLLSCQPSVKDAENIFRQMQHANIEPDVISYASRLNAFSKARRGEEAQYFFKKMVASGIRPNCTVYNVLLDAYASCKMVKEAESLLKEMRRERCSPDVYSFTTLMNAYVNISNMEKAEKVLERMKLAGIEPNVVTYGTLIKGYAEKGDLDGMVKKYDEMLSHQQLKANQTIFMIMLQAFGRYDSLDRAMSWFKKIIATGLALDVRADNTLLALSTATNRREEVSEFLDSML